MSISGSARYVFLLGAGVSRPAGIPVAKDITERVLSGTDVWRHTDSRYYVGGRPPSLSSDDYVWRIILLLGRLKRRLEDTGQCGPANYEDLYDKALKVFEDTQAGCRLIVGPDGSDLADAPILQTRAGGVMQPWMLDQLAFQATNYIRDIVMQLLSQPPRQLSHLEWLVEAIREATCQVDVFTLNHESVLEQCLRGHNIQFADGFDDCDGGLRCWDSRRLRQQSTEVRLVKLHGGIDWFALNATTPDGSPMLGIRRPGTGPEYVRSDGSRLKVSYDWPVFLTGTDRKVRQYTQGVFKDLHEAFQRSLCTQEPPRLVVCGYGFRDRGINDVLRRWTTLPGEHHMVVAHGCRADLQRTWQSSANEGPDWSALERAGRIRIVEKWVQELTWSDIACAAQG